VDEYFRSRPAMAQPYTQAAAYVRGLGVDRVGLVARVDDWEYPFWPLLATDEHDVEVVAVDVTNESADLETSRRPSVVICICARDVGADVDVRRFGLVQVEMSSR
jgi:hypothetical protein